MWAHDNKINWCESHHTDFCAAWLASYVNKADATADSVYALLSTTSPT